MPRNSIVSAEELYADYLRVHAQQGVAFEDWVESHPEHAFDLELLHVESRAVKQAASLFRGEKSPDPSAHPELGVGRRIADFELVGLLGQGGMGQVWEARQLSLGGRSVALKFVRPECATTQRLDLFQREARAGGRLHHPGLVSILAYGEEGDLAWIAMELVPGAWTLRDAMAELSLEALPAGYDRRVAGLVAEIADAMQAAHDSGIVHRDLKPSNVLIDPDERPRVADFGLARILDEASLTHTGELGGTYFYMSPEQVAAKRIPIDARSDVFSLGAVLYEMLTLQRAFQGDTSHQVVEQVLLKEPPDPRTIRSRIAPELVWICGKALEKDRDRRYASMAEFAADLRAFLEDRPILARKPSLAVRARRWCRLHTVAATAGGVLALTSAIVSALLVVLARTNTDLDAESRSLARSNAGLEAANSALERQRAELEAAGITNRRQAEQILRALLLQDIEDRFREAADLWPPHPDLIGPYEDWIASASAITQTLPQHRSAMVALEEQLAVARERDDPELRQLIAHERRLASLIERIEDLEHPDTGLLSPAGLDPVRGWSVPRRLELARSMAQAFAPGGAHAEAWNRALPALRERYPDVDWYPRMGLVPLAADRESGLWEFWHVLTGERPERGADGRLAITEESGVVLVLLPAGRFHMGSSRDPDSGNHDPWGREDEEPVHEVALDAFFCAKYELTQGQWLRITGNNPSYHAYEKEGDIYTLVHPVDSLSWDAATTWLPRVGLTLPTEAQWEYAARAGTRSVWWTGSEKQSLALGPAVNIADTTALESWTGAEAFIDDGYMAHAPVGTFRANAFGLYDVIGNVLEPCLDAHGRYEPGPLTNPFREWNPGDQRVLRGGGFDQAATNSRSAGRFQCLPSFVYSSLGARAARPLDD